MIENCNILVTGGAGFIGSHIATRLAEANKVIIFDIFTTGRKRNVAHLQDNPNVKILLIDIRDRDPLVKYSDGGFDYIFHLAAISSVPQSIEDPIATNDHNINGTLNILHAAEQLEGCKVIFSSSASVYGDEPTLPKLETMLTTPKSPYAVTKIGCEQYCRMYSELYDLPTVSLRYFNVFGPNQDPRSEYAAVVPKFMELVRQGKAPTIFGDGEQLRDFIYVADVVDANIQAALSEKANGETFNIASGKPISINQLANIIIDLSGNTLEPEYMPPRPGDIKNSYADISKAKRLLDWQPKTEIRNGLNLTYDFFKKQNQDI